jgi:uncharacterized protein (TIGR03085 family)
MVVINQPLDAAEREQLSTLMAELGPEAPTLLGSWTTRDLAAHLVLREHDLLAAPGLVVPGAWSRFAERRRAALTQRDYAQLLTTIRTGPPPGFFRIGWVRRVANLNEYFVHHEDVRRANRFVPRPSTDALDRALWHNVRLARRFLTRRLRDVGLELEWAEAAEVLRARSGTPTARVTGTPAELLMYLFGRGNAACVEVSGPSGAVDAVRRARFGM